jgi:membrane peptidoglycan carboxypeptidase
VVADNVNDVLKGVIAFGTGVAADVGRPDGTAGKTGTAEDFSDAWFVGYGQKLVTSVWMGYANSQKSLENIKGVSKVFGGTLPAMTWKAYMSQALAGIPDLPFPPPGRLPNAKEAPGAPGPDQSPGPFTGPIPTAPAEPATEPEATIPPISFPAPTVPPLNLPPRTFVPPRTIYIPPPTFPPPTTP